MQFFSSAIKKLFLPLSLSLLATGLAVGQGDFSAGDTTAVTGGEASGNTFDDSRNRSTNRRIIYDRGASSIGQYDPSGNSLPEEVSPYESIGTNRPARKAAKKSDPGYRDSGRSSIGQPDPTPNYTAPAGGVVQSDDAYFSNSPAKDKNNSNTAAEPAGWGNTADTEESSTEPGRDKDQKNSGRKKQ